MLDFVAQAVQTVYGLQIISIQSLQQQDLDWRGIYQLTMANGQSWILRLIKYPGAFSAMTQTANLLDWLSHQAYPAPRVYPTLTGRAIGEFNEFSLLLVSFIEGSVSKPDPEQLYLLGSMMGRLHALSFEESQLLPPSRTHPEEIRSITLPRLRRYEERLPLKFQRFAEKLTRDTERIIQRDHKACMTHGDCWYKNAIVTPSGSVQLIDWDCAGTGLAVLDFGYLLLTSHYDLSRPFQLEANEHKIRSIIEGYAEYGSFSSIDPALLLSAVRFALAVHLGNYMDQDDHLQEDDFFLNKMQARYEVTEPIAEIAGKLLG